MLRVRVSLSGLTLHTQKCCAFYQILSQVLLQERRGNGADGEDWSWEPGAAGGRCEV